MMKLPGIESIQARASSAVESLFRIVGGDSGALKHGKTVRLVMPEIISSKSVVMVQGRELTVEGLPKSLAGSVVQARISGPADAPLLEIVARGENTKASLPSASEGGVESQLAGKVAAEPSPKATDTPSPLKTHVATSRHAMQFRSARLISPLQSLPLPLPEKGERFAAMVVKAGTKQAMLTPIPQSLPHVSSPTRSPKMLAAKTAHAIAHLKQPQQLLKGRAEAAMPIRIEQLSMPVKTGERYQVEIKSLRTGKKPELLLRPLQPGSIGPASGKAVRAGVQAGVQARMATGGMPLPDRGSFSARIEQRLPDGGIVLNWRGTRFESRAPEEIRVGDRVVIKATPGNRPSFEVVDVVKDIPEKAATLFRERLTRSEPLKQALTTLLSSRTTPQPVATAATGGTTALPAPTANQIATLTTLLDSYTISAERPLDGTRVTAMIRNSGLFHEALLGKAVVEDGGQGVNRAEHNNLKAVLLKLVETAQASDSASRTLQIGHASEQGSNRIESHQALNLLALHQAEPLRIEFPLLMGGLLSTVQMAVSMQPSPEQHDNETAEQRDEAVSILFALDLSALGTVNIDARITTRSLHAAIYSQQEGARSFMQQHLERLSQRLDALGFKEVHLTTLQLAEVGEEKRERFEKLAHGLPLSTGLLDVTG